MDTKKIEGFYNKGKYREIIDTYNNEKDINLHIKRLIVRAYNKLSQSIGSIFEDDAEIKDDIDYKFNTIVLSENKQDKDTLFGLLKDILHEGREDLLEDFIIFYFEKYDEFPVFDGLMQYVLENKNRPIIKKYMKSIEDELNDKWKIIYALINNKDLKTIVKQFDNDVLITATNIFLNKNNVSVDDIMSFFNCMEFKKDHFFIFNNDIYRIHAYSKEDDKFIIYDKFGNEKTMNAEEIILKTKPIESNDFRVYKYFNPEKAKQLGICDLLKSIIKYYGNAVDKQSLIKELSYIYEHNAISFYKKNKKKFSECNGIHVIFSKNEKYMLNKNNEDQILLHIKRLKDIRKIRDYIIGIDNINDNSKTLLKDYFQNNNSFIVNEIMYFLTHKDIYVNFSIDADIEQFKYDKFIAQLIIAKSKLNKLDKFDFNSVKPATIETVYKGVNEKYKKRIIDNVNEALRLKQSLNLLQWYAIYHIEENLVSFPLKDVCILYFEIADAKAIKSKGDDFLSFVRKFFFTSSNAFFMKLIDKLNKDDFKECFDYFITTNILNDYQIDNIKIKVYKIYPDFRKFEIIEYDYSTKKGIKLKEQELNNIIRKTLPELSQKIKDAAAQGDLKENAEYKYAREQYNFYSAKAEEIKKELSMMQPIDFSSIDKQKVSIGNIVLVEDIKTKQRTQYIVLGSFDTDFGENIISYKSPLGKKLLNKKVGDIIDNKKIIEINIYREEE